MSKAVFIYTFLRLMRPGNFVSLFLWLIALPIYIAWMCCADYHTSFNNANFAMEQVAHFFTGPIIPIVTAMLVVGTTVGNTKSLHNGEYFLLTFTRPLSRFSYVFSKWCAALLAVVSITSCQILCLAISFYVLGHITHYPLGLTDVANLLLNAMAGTALIVFIQCCPIWLGVNLYMVALLCIMFNPYFITGASPRIALTGTEPLWFKILVEIFDKVYPVVQDFLTPFIDIAPFFNSIEVWWLPIFSFLSNFVLYLWLAVLVLNSREFFYANE